MTDDAQDWVVVLRFVAAMAFVLGAIAGTGVTCVAMRNDAGGHGLSTPAAIARADYPEHADEYDCEAAGGQWDAAARRCIPLHEAAGMECELVVKDWGEYTVCYPHGEEE